MTTKGFTIIESLIAIAILVAVIIGASSAVQTGISSYTASRDQIIAFYLAQESFEQLRNMRDENRLRNRNWLYGIAELSSDPCYYPAYGGSSCATDSIAGTLTRCSSVGACPYLRQDTVTGLYSLDSAWPVTRFRREVTLSTPNSDQEVAVTVTVSWTKGAFTREFKAKEVLFNW